MKLVSIEKKEKYTQSIYESVKGRVFIMTTKNIEVFKKIKIRGNSGGYTVTKVFIYGDNKSFKLVVRKGDIYKLGRTVYYKHGRKIPFYLTGL